MTDERRPRVLHAIHDFLPRHRAGSEIYAAELGRALQRDCHVTILAAEHDLTRPDGELAWRVHDGLPVVELVNNWVVTGFEDTYAPDAVTTRLEQILDAVQPDVLHVHSLLNLSFELVALARARRIPVVATLHDYSLLCPSGGQRVHRAESHVCFTIEPDRCARCFRESPFHTLGFVGRTAAATAQVGDVRRRARIGAALRLGRLAAGLARRLPRAAVRVGSVMRNTSTAAPTALDIDERLRRARAVFEAFDLVVAPSASLAHEFARLGMPTANVAVSDYGFRAMSRVPREPRTLVRFGYMGTVVWHKGLHLLIEATRGLPADGWELEIHGDPRTFPDYTAQLRDAAAGRPIHFRGRYDHASAGAILARLDALIVPSLWLENSPLVIHEAFQAGVPVIGARMGGIADLVQDGVNGLLYDAWSVSDLGGILGRALQDPSVLTNLASGVPAVKAIEEDAREWMGRYAAVRRASRAAEVSG